MRKLVRYVSPFGSPAWMTREKALALLAEDDRRWVMFQFADILSKRQREIGPPRIETP